MTVRPFDQSYGGKTDAWNILLGELKSARIPTGELAFPKGIPSKRAIADRFEALMTFQKRRENENPMKSGTDDEEEPSELEQLLESLYVLKESSREKNDNKKAVNTKTRHRHKLQTIAILDAASKSASAKGSLNKAKESMRDIDLRNLGQQERSPTESRNNMKESMEN